MSLFSISNMNKGSFSQLWLYVWMKVATNSPLIYGTALCVKVSFTRQTGSFNDFESRWWLLDSYFSLSKNLQNEQRNFETNFKEREQYHITVLQEIICTNITILQVGFIAFDHEKRCFNLTNQVKYVFMSINIFTM